MRVRKNDACGQALPYARYYNTLQITAHSRKKMNGKFEIRLHVNAPPFFWIIGLIFEIHVIYKSVRKIQNQSDNPEIITKWNRT